MKWHEFYTKVSLEPDTPADVALMVKQPTAVTQLKLGYLNGQDRWDCIHEVTLQIDGFWWSLTAEDIAKGDTLPKIRMAVRVINDFSDTLPPGVQMDAQCMILARQADDCTFMNIVLPEELFVDEEASESLANAGAVKDFDPEAASAPTF